MSNILQDVIAHVESSDNQFAVRFEPVTFQNKPIWILGTLVNIQQAHKCDKDTALMIACTSWGYYQLLGANIYANNAWKDTVFDYMEIVEAQSQGFARFIAPHDFVANEIIDDWNDERFTQFATFYNGPGNVANYVAEMKKAMV